MQITGNVEKLELSSIKFINLKGIENKCQESFEDFKEGDDIVIISRGVIKNGNIEMDDGIYFVKKEFIDRFLVRFVENIKQQNENTPITDQPNQQSE